MGGSLLRAMAFGKPCIVQGECGFFRLLDTTTAREFRWRGFYGIGTEADDRNGETTLVELVERLLGDETLRKENAEFALSLVRQFYSLEYAIQLQLDWYDRVLAEYTRRRCASRPHGRGGEHVDRRPRGQAAPRHRAGGLLQQRRPHPRGLRQPGARLVPARAGALTAGCRPRVRTAVMPPSPGCARCSAARTPRPARHPGRAAA